MTESTTWAFNFLTFLNHGIFAALFLWRLVISPDGLSPDPTRALKVESETVCAMIGCDPVDVNRRSVAIIKPFFESSGLGDGAFFMFWYMTLEGCLHIGICYGSFLLLFIKRTRYAEKVYQWALLGEIILMDIAYTAGFNGVMYYCGFNSDKCVPPNVSNNGTFIDGALYAYFILTVTWLQNISVIMDLVTYPVELECAGRALLIDASTEKKKS